MTAMVPRLEQRGLIAEGERHEEVVIIRGRRAARVEHAGALGSPTYGFPG
jgi:hypothetical protein